TIESIPVVTTCPKLSPNPRNIIDHCKIDLLENCRPGLKIDDTPKMFRITKPNKIANTGPPTVGNCLHKRNAINPTSPAKATPYHSEGVWGLSYCSSFTVNSFCCSVFWAAIDISIPMI